ncbi:MAG: hydrogenase expression/formation protein HypE [Deltaproteobacteria bacterium]|nr:hydrogenase expression/formation protein HypE [Deltaproteobacteria bacterium]MBZ0219405.1 hydrogenase expression/formation protein HypE [Deltaproteobacteria bacterium]
MTKDIKTILLAHGSGGSHSRRLVEDLFAKAFTNPFLAPLNDQAVFAPPAGRLAFTTDSYVVKPIFFPGGDIGKLAVCGTINDLAVGGAEPLYLSASFIIEEGLPMDELERVVDSMAKTALDAGVMIVTGDTKVVERGKGDKLFINTAGIGRIDGSLDLAPTNIRAGDAVIVSGTMGDHGIAILTHREGIRMETPVESDCAALHTLAKAVLDAEPSGVRAMRDPTRGGLATVLNEFASSSGLSISVREDDIPIKEAVRGACEILGFDPLYLANEGKLVAVVSRESADSVLKAMRSHPNGRDAAIIGTVEEEPKARVLIETSIGNKRILDMLSGEQLPRIC